ncbi:MAG TPA: chloride channel protein [Longimicrobiales bacterium]
MDQEVARSSTTDGLPVAPSMGPALESVRVPREYAPVDRRVVFISAMAVLVAIAAGFMAEFLTRLIGLITSLAFFGRISFDFVAPVGTDLGAWIIVVPVAGAVVVGLMARYGTPAIRGHGIPEVMERVLYAKSRISPRVMLLKPLSAAVAIGTGGPFGAEGPIIATGGALGSLVGQGLRITIDERKTLLAAGAAAGMTATFGSPVSAVLLAIELLLFEYRARSIIPVALASATATAMRIAMVGSEPIFAMPNLAQPGGAALAAYIVLGAVVGVASVYVTRVVYAIEDGFGRLPVHWMWWPALGAVVVGIVGAIEPRTLGVGYYNIEQILSGELVGTALIVLVGLKFISWSIYLGSGTSGGTLAPLFTIGGGMGALLGAGAIALLPGLDLDVRVAALVGMAAIFAGASHALLASVVFAFETTRQPLGLLPLLGGCAAAYLISQLLMRNSIMTEKLARRGVSIRTEYAIDYLSRVLVRDGMTRSVVALSADDTLDSVRAWLASRAEGTSHQGFPVLDARGFLVGVVTRRNLFGADRPGDLRVRQVIERPAVAVFEDNTLREAADHMVREGVGRLPVVSRRAPRKVVGMITRSDLLAAHQERLEAAFRPTRPRLGGLGDRRRRRSA